jgi:hypothetical protein
MHHGICDRFFLRNLRWTSDGEVWASWRLNPLSRARTPGVAELVHAAHAALYRALPGRQVLLQGVLTWTDPNHIVDKMIEGIDLAANPEWAAECNAVIDTLEETAFGQRRFFLHVRLQASTRQRTATWARTAFNAVADGVGLGGLAPGHQEISVYRDDARQVERELPAVFEPVALTEAEQVWLRRHAQQRTGDLVDPVQAPDLADELLEATGRAAVGDPLLDPSAISDLTPGSVSATARLQAPFRRRFLKVITDTGEENYQSGLILSKVPRGMAFPASEFLGRIDDAGVPVDFALAMTIRSRHTALSKNKRALKQLNDQLDQVSEADVQHAAQLLRLHDAAEVLAEYHSEMQRDDHEVEIESEVMVSTAAATSTDADQQAAAFQRAPMNDALTWARPIGAEADLFWAMQPGTPVTRQLRDYRQITHSAAYATAAPITTHDLGSDAGILLGRNISSPLQTPLFLDLFGDTQKNLSPSLAVVADVGAGKALALDTPIATPGGWTTMGELSVGDEVFDERGQPTVVTGTSPVRHGRRCYEVAFSDRTTIVADAEHLWTTLDVLARQATSPSHAPRHAVLVASTTSRPLKAEEGLERGEGVADWTRRGRTVTTEQIASSLTRGRFNNHSIPVARALELPAADLPIDPYVLGAWMGDGTARCGQLTSADPELLTFIKAAGYEVVKLASRYQYAVKVRVDPPVRETRPCAWCSSTMVCRYPARRYCSRSCVHEARKAGRPAIGEATCLDCGRAWRAGSIGRRCPDCRRATTLTGCLRQLGVLRNKHLPTLYLRASINQRRALLAGLLDTDGTVSPGGAVEFCSTSQRLASDVRELACSLGYRAALRCKTARLAGKECGTAWTVSFTTADDVFWLTRKRDAHSRRGQRRSPARNGQRYIVAVRPVESVPVRCITVASASRLFLAGPTMVPTHNSVTQKKICGDTVDRGGRMIATDNSTTREWFTFAASLDCSKAEVDCADPSASLDPLRTMDPRLAGPVVQSLLTTLLNVGATDIEGRTIAKVVKPGYLRTHSIDSMGTLHRHLAHGCELPLAAEIADRIDVFSDPDTAGSLAAAIFDPKLPPIDLDARAVVIGTSNVRLPTANELASAHRFKTLPVDKLFGRALYALIAQLAKQVCFADPGDPAIFNVDEAHHVTSSEEAIQTCIEFVRYGRKSKAGAVFGSHNPEDDFPDTTLRGLIRNRLVMRQPDPDLARRSAEFLGFSAEDNPELFEQTVADIINLPASQGVGVMRDSMGRIGDVQIMLPARPERRQAVLTTPPERARTR